MPHQALGQPPKNKEKNGKRIVTTTFSLLAPVVPRRLRLAWSESLYLADTPLEDGKTLLQDWCNPQNAYTVTLEILVIDQEDGEHQWWALNDLSDEMIKNFDLPIGDASDGFTTEDVPEGESAEDFICDPSPYQEAENLLLNRLGLCRSDLTDPTEDLP